MCREEWVRALSRASRVGDRVSVGAVREVLGDLPDDADVVVAVRDGSGSAATVGSVLVEHVEPCGGPGATTRASRSASAPRPRPGPTEAGA